MTGTGKATATAAAAFIVAGALAACGISAQPAGNPTSNPSTSTAAATTVTQTPEQQAEALARAAVAKFYRGRDEAVFDPQQTTADFFNSFAVGSALVEEQNTWRAAKAQRARQVGYTEIKSVTHLSTDLRTDANASPPAIPTVQFLVCYDVSKVDILDQDGKSVVPPSRKPTGLKRVGVANYHYPSTTDWLVAYSERKADSC